MRKYVTRASEEGCEKAATSLVRRRKIIITVLITIGFMAVEFPGILIVMDIVYPFIFGLPFLYGYLLCWWLYFCLVFFYAYKTSWGRKSFFNDKK